MNDIYIYMCVCMYIYIYIFVLADLAVYSVWDEVPGLQVSRYLRLKSWRWSMMSSRQAGRTIPTLLQIVACSLEAALLLGKE